MYSKTNIFLLFIYTEFVQCATKKKHFQFVQVCRVKQILFPAGTNEHRVCNVLIALQCTLAAELMTNYSLHIMLLFTTWETYTGSETVTIRLDVQYIL